MSAFLASLLRVAGVALLASAVGGFTVRALFPRLGASRGERLAWGVAIGMALLAGFVPLSFLVGVKPGWPSFAILAAACLVVGVAFRVSSADSGVAPRRLEARDSRLEARPSTVVLSLLVLLGVAIYALQALTEPMWSNDFLAIWGLKGKIVFASASLPRSLFESPNLGFSHPEYPLGLPFLYAGVAFLTGGWDDHAMALLFPLFQVATLAALVGFLRRRGAGTTAALLAAAVLANWEPLYSAFLTGLAEIPLSFGLLLFGSALADAFEPAEPGSLRRLALSAALLAATKNEGLFLAAAGCGVGLILGGARRWRIVAAALPTALLVHGLHLLWRGRLPLRDFDFGLFSGGRLGETLSAAVRVFGPAAWMSGALLLALILLGRRRTDAHAMLAVAVCAEAAYVLLPVFAVRGPTWLVQTTLVRVTAGLAPLLAAAVALGDPAAPAVPAARVPRP